MSTDFDERPGDNRILESLSHAEEASFRSASNAAKADFIDGTREAVFKSLDDWVASESTAARAARRALTAGRNGTQLLEKTVLDE